MLLRVVHCLPALPLPPSKNLDYPQVVTLIWLRRYPTHEVLAWLFGVSDSTTVRVIARVVPLLEHLGHDTMRFPDPGKHHRRQFDELLADLPELAVVIDTFEQPVHRPQRRVEADRWYSGKKKTHTIKSQVAVDVHSGRFCDVGESVPGQRSTSRCSSSPPCWTGCRRGWGRKAI
jgi:hypothetical protein